MHCILLFVRVPGPSKTSCACDDEQPGRARYGTAKGLNRIQPREGGGSNLPIFYVGMCVSDDPKL